MKYLQLLSLAAIFLSSNLVAQTFIEGPIPEGEIGYVCAPCGCAHDEGHFDSIGTCPSCNMTLAATMPGVKSMMPSHRSLTAAMLIFDHADIMDVTGPWSVLVHNGVRVVSFAKTKDPVRVGMSMTLTPDFTLDNLPDVDILVFPGSGLAESNPGDEQIQKFIKERAESTEVLFSVCSGAFFLAEAGLLDGKTATTFASFIPTLEQDYPEINVVNDVKYTDNGQVVTTAGLSSGIDGAFHVVSKFRGQGYVQDQANRMEYSWSKSTDYARSQLADRYIEGIKNVVSLVSKEYRSSSGDRNSWEYQYVLSGEVSNKQVLKLLNIQLENTGKWELTREKGLSLEGAFTHDILGTGIIAIDIEKDGDEEIITISAKREKEYQVVSNSNQ